LSTGLAQGADAGAVQTYPARTEGGRVFLDARFLRRRTAA
jgi:nitrite reductase (NADH) small subunit